MLTRKEIVLLKKLKKKQQRTKEGLFVVEGKSSVFTFLEADYRPEYLLATPLFIEKNPQIKAYEPFLHQVNKDILAQVSSLKSPPPVLLVTKQPKYALPSPTLGKRMLFLDDIRDPGNLGAMIRIADWYQIQHIVASPTTVDCYNPKVVQASMGSLAHIQVHYTPLIPYIKASKKARKEVIGAVLEGENLHKTPLPTTGCLLIGNETHGINPRLKQEITHSVTIPRFGKAESLNAAIATAILCDHWQQVC